MTQYRILAEITPDCGGYSAIAVNLPGCCSQGDSPTEALANLKEAATGCVTSYLEAGRAPPFVVVTRTTGLYTTTVEA